MLWLLVLWIRSYLLVQHLKNYSVYLTVKFILYKKYKYKKKEYKK